MIYFPFTYIYVADDEKELSSFSLSGSGVHGNKTFLVFV